MAKLFSQEGCDSGVKTVCRPLTKGEKKIVNDKLRGEQGKFPDHKVQALIGENSKGNITVDFVYQLRPQKTLDDKIDSIIDSVKKGKIRPPKL